jgi:23S rRNA pseudouridine1911/1915/1917 synthase
MTDENGTAAGRSFVADRGDASGRLDQAIVRRLADVPRISRTRVQRWIDAGQVIVNGRRAHRASGPVAAGDCIEVRADDVRVVRATPQPEALALDVLYEDDYLLAINKPAGIVVHPSYKHPGGTLLNALLAHIAAGTTPDAQPRLLQRLDKQTSGVLLVSKSRAVHAAVQRALQTDQARKEYLAVVYGCPRNATGIIDLPLGRDAIDRRRVVVQEHGRPSQTRYEVVATEHGISVLRCELLTGRMHQIRVHLGASGWPLVGDAVYGNLARAGAISDPALAARARNFPRQALHAFALSLVHPVSSQRLQVVAPVPQDIRDLLDFSP